MKLRVIVRWLWILTWAGSPGWAAESGEVIVRGRGVEIRRTELDRAADRLKTEALNRGQALDEVQLDGLKEQLLEQLILVRLCQARAEESDRALARIESGRFVARLKATQGEEGFLRLLKRSGYTEPEFLSEKVAQALVTAVIDREVKSTIRIPTQDVRAYYESNPDRWVEPGAVRYRYLQRAAPDPLKTSTVDQAAVRKEMEDWRREVEGGRDFGLLIRAVTGGESPRAMGGEKQVVRGQLAVEVESEVFRLEPGKTSAVIDAGGLLSLYEVLERIPPRRMPLEKVDEDIRALLLQRESRTRIPEYVTQIRKEAGVEVFWKPGQHR